MGTESGLGAQMQSSLPTFCWTARPPSPHTPELPLSFCCLPRHPEDWMGTVPAAFPHTQALPSCCLAESAHCVEKETVSQIPGPAVSSIDSRRPWEVGKIFWELDQLHNWRMPMQIGRARSPPVRK